MAKPDPHGRERRGPDTELRTRSDDRYAKWDTRIRSGVLLVFGIAGGINELFVKPEPSQVSLIFIGAVLGLPFALYADDVRRRFGNGKQ